MMPGGSLRLTGDLHTRLLLDQAPRRVRDLVLRRALRAAGKIVLARARELAPVRATRKKKDGTRVRGGTLRRSLRVRAMKRTRKGRIGVVVQSAAGNFGGKAFYTGLQEFGWRVGRRSAGGRRGKKQARATLAARAEAARGALAADQRRLVPGKHFMQRAFDETVESSQRAVVEAVRAALVLEERSARHG